MPARRRSLAVGSRGRRRSRSLAWSSAHLPSGSPAPFSTRRDPAVFPFGLLPVECRVHVLSFLTEVEKCTAALVCRSWSQLVRTGKLWRVADFTRRGVTLLGMESMLVSIKEFERWKAWVHQYAHHLASRRASLLVLRASFNLGDQESRWVEFLSEFLESVHCGDLSELGLNWTFTQLEPLGVCLQPKHKYSSHQESLTKMEQVTNFQELLRKLVQNCPRVTTMRLHFDWSQTSLSLLSRFQHLCVLELKYFWVFKGVSPSTMRSLTRSLHNLKSLTLHVLVPLRDLGVSYCLESRSLEFLDVSPSRGLVFSCLDLPALRELRAKKVLRGITLDCRTRLEIQSQWPCLYQILRNGTPQLQVLNSERLLPSWREEGYQELTAALEQSCYCLKHSDSWLW